MQSRRGYAVRFRRPVLVIAQEIFFVPVIHCSFEEEPAYAQVSHLLEAAIGGVNSAGDHAKPFPPPLLAEPVIFGEQNLFVKSAEFPELLAIKQHEHARGKGAVQGREILKN